MNTNAPRHSRAPHLRGLSAGLLVLAAAFVFVGAALGGTQPGPAFVVNTLADTNDSSCDLLGTGTGNNDCTLREAINAANTRPNDASITFSVSGTITLGSALPTLDRSMTMDGAGQSVAISGNNQVRVFATATASSTININALTVTQGMAQGGGGIKVASATVNITNCTFSGNSGSGTQFGGAIAVTERARVVVANSTFFNNTANNGGAIWVFGTNGGRSTLYVYNSTFAGNTIMAGNTAGTAIHHSDGFPVTIEVRNSVMVGGTGQFGNWRNCYGFQNSYSNNVSNDSSCGSPAVSAAAINLDTLKDNGGATKTIALLPGSVAINAGDNSVASAAPVANRDQRGYDRIRTGDATSDAGAYEAGASGSVVVNTASDLPPSTTLNTLRKALAYATSIGGAQTITFAPGLAGQTITVSDGWNGPNDDSALRVSSNVTVDGGTGVVINLAAPSARRTFLNSGTLTLRNLTLSGGDLQGGDGGALWSNGTAALEQVHFTTNRASKGGAVANYGTMSVRNCTFSGNVAQTDAGALHSEAGSTSLLIENSTFSGNSSAGSSSSAITTGAQQTTYRHLTVTNNTGGSGALLLYQYPTTMVNSIVAGNSPDGILQGNGAAFSAQSTNNILGSGGTGGLTNGTNGNLTGVPANQLLLGTLGSNGGATPTVALLPGSLAVNRGVAINGISADQRGILRPQYGVVDVGAYEQTPFDTGQTIVSTGGAYWYLGPDAVGADLRIYREVPGEVPVEVGGLAARIGLASDGTILVQNAGGAVYARIGSNSGIGIGWQQLSSVVAGDGSTWFLGPDANGSDFPIYRWASGGLANVGGFGAQLFVTPDGNIVVRNSAGQFFYRTGSSNGLGTGWAQVNQSLVVTTAADENNGVSDPSYGAGTSLREALTYARSPLYLSGLGSNGTGWSLNHNGAAPATISADVLQITSNTGGIANSAWYGQKVDVTDFTARFRYTQDKGNDGADGFTLTIQNSGLNALGAPGGALGYGGISSSAAIAFNIFNGLTQGVAAFTGGNVTGSYTAPGNGVSLTNGQPVDVTVTGSGTGVSVTLTQGSNSATFNYPNLNIASAVGAKYATIGFTGGTGGSTAVQRISNFSLTTASAPRTVTFAPALAGETVTLNTGWDGPGDQHALEVTSDVTLQGLTTAPGVTIAVAPGVQMRHLYVAPGGNLTVRHLTFTDGKGSSYGGSIWSQGSLTVSHCTFAGNAAGAEGGAIQSWGDSPSLLIENSTFTGNTSMGNAGAINAGAASMRFNHVTISNNTSNDGSALAIWGHPLTMVNSIIAGTGSEGVASTNSGTFSAASTNNIFSSANAPGLTNGTNSNRLGVAASQLQLGSLAGNGGPTPTMPLQVGSIAHNAGVNIAGVTTDQRGVERPQFNIPDIGAYELGSNEASLVVDAVADEDHGLTTLREALLWARLLGGAQTITFDPALAGQTVMLSTAWSDEDTYRRSSALFIETEITIQGPNSSPGITLKVADSAQLRHFVIFGGGKLTLENLTLSGGKASTYGHDYGGSIWNFYTLTVRNCTFTGNTAGAEGGAIHSWFNSNAVSIENSTFAGNHADGSAGAIHSGAFSTALRYVTISNNTAADGNALVINKHALTSVASLIAGTGNEGVGSVDGGSFAAGSTDNILSSATAPGLTHGSNGNQLGVPVNQLWLGPLADNGGPTRTIALQPGSLAIDSAAPIDGIVTDARGTARPDGDAADAGAYELVQTNAVAPIINPASGTFEHSVQVSISSPSPNTYVRYTTDGTEPTPSHGKLYTGPFTLTSGDGSDVQAIAYGRGWIPSQGLLADFNLFEPFRYWRALHGLFDGSYESDRANPSGDGVVNILKYAFNLAPNAGDLAKPNAQILTPNGTAGLPLLTRDAQGRLVLQFIRRKATTNPGIAYIPETGTDMLTWTPLDLTNATVVSVGSVWERVTVVDPVISNTRIGRVRVTSAGAYYNDFDLGLGPAEVFGSAKATNGAVELTDGVTAGQVGTLVIEDVALGSDDPGDTVLTGFTARFNVKLGPSATGTPGEGLCFAVGDLPNAAAWGETGPGVDHVLAVGFDTSENGGSSSRGIHIWVNGVHVAANPVDPYTNGALVPVEITWEGNSALTVKYNGATIFDRFPISGFQLRGDTEDSDEDEFGFGARTSSVVQRALVDEVQIEPRF